MSVVIDRHATLETITVEVDTGDTDGQGIPVFDSEVDISAYVAREDKLAVSADGSEVRTSLTIWVPAGEDVLPDEGDRITRGTENFIGREYREIKRLNGDVSHIRLRCSEE